MSAPRFCPSCGAATSAVEGANVAFCSACGGSLTVAGHTQIGIGPSADNLLGLARTAALAGNAQEAYDYAVRVLESDPRSVDAWLIKATSAGWLSTLAVLRIREMVVTYQGALGMAGADDRDVRSEILLGINNVGVAVHNLSLEHVLEFPMLENLGWTTSDGASRSLKLSTSPWNLSRGIANCLRTVSRLQADSSREFATRSPMAPRTYYISLPMRRPLCSGVSRRGRT